jgi:hypothetical protein
MNKIHTDLGIQYVQDIQKKCIKYHTALEVHNNPLLKTLLARKEHRRLKKNMVNRSDLRYWGIATGRLLIKTFHQL